MKLSGVFTLLLLVTSSPLAAERNPKTETVIGPQDTITIVALQSEEISKEWRVGLNGDLNLAMVGKIQAAGMRVDQLEQEITTRLRRYVRNPQVTVFVSEFRSQPVTVSGAVEKPGTLQREGRKTLLEMLMAAGGPKAAGPSVTVTRHVSGGRIPFAEAKQKREGDFNVVQLSLSEVMDASTPAANLIIEPEDVIHVSTQVDLVYIMGEVNRPGAVELVTQDSVSIVQVLAAAGGLTRTASAHKASVLRLDHDGLYSKATAVNVKSIISGEHADLRLMPGDIVVIPSGRGLRYYLDAASTSALTSGIYILTRF